MQIIKEIENEKKLRADYEEIMLKITNKQRAEEIKGKAEQFKQVKAETKLQELKR